MEDSAFVGKYRKLVEDTGFHLEPDAISSAIVLLVDAQGNRASRKQAENFFVGYEKIQRETGYFLSTRSTVDGLVLLWHSTGDEHGVIKFGDGTIEFTPGVIKSRGISQVDLERLGYT